MAKRKAVGSSVDPSSSDDTDDSNSGKARKRLNKILSETANLNSKKRQLLQKEFNQNLVDNVLTPLFLKREHTEDEEGTVESESDCGNVKPVKEVIKNVPSKVSRKLKKKKKQDIYNSDLSDGENVSNWSLHSSNKNSFDNTKIKIKKEKKKASKSINECSDSDNENEYIDRNSLQQTNFFNIKKEVISEDADSNSEESDLDISNSSELVNKKTVIKNEVQSNPSSDDDEDGVNNVANARKPLTEHTKPVTILQDIRLTPKGKSTKEKLKELYPGLKPIELTTELILSDSDEVHLLRIPKNVDAKLLKHAEINLEEQCKVDLGAKYLITPTSKIPDPALVISANTSVLHFKNNIKLAKYIKVKREPSIPVPERKPVPLPENLKTRHPLFGSDFKQKIILNQQVEKKLDEAIANLLKHERKANKKKKKQDEVKEDKSNQEIINFFNSFLTNHDRIKKETSDDSAFGSSCSTDKPRSRKKDTVHMSDKRMEQESVPGTELSKKKKEKKKNKSDREWLDESGIKKEDEDIDTFDAVDPGPSTSTSPKKRKKNSSIVNSTLMSDVLRTPQFKCEVSTIVPESSSGKKSKKSKKDKMSKNESSIKEELISQLLNDVTMKIGAPKKIKMEF